MELSRKERWLLANQYRILQALAGEDEETGSYAGVIEALESGYEWEYESYSSHIYEDTLSETECRFVVNVMAMYDAMQTAYSQLGTADKAAIDKDDLWFPGFDGNNETSYMAYARFFVEKKKRFEGLSKNNDLNSHLPSIDRYRRMLDVWKDRYGKSYQLTAAQIREILG